MRVHRSSGTGLPGVGHLRLVSWLHARHTTPTQSCIAPSHEARETIESVNHCGASWPSQLHALQHGQLVLASSQFEVNERNQRFPVTKDPWELLQCRMPALRKLVDHPPNGARIVLDFWQLGSGQHLCGLLVSESLDVLTTDALTDDLTHVWS